MRQLKSCLSIFLSLCIITIFASASFQGEDPLTELFKDINIFIHLEVMTNKNLNCQEATYNSIQNTQLGHIMSNFFEVLFEMNLRDYLFDRYPEEYVINQGRRSRQNLLRLSVWMEQERRDTTPEDINNMRQQLEDLKTQFDSCLIDNSAK